MTREELIALSDLNREDNIKYISSEAQGIAIALDSDRYSPTLCKLERAYICGRRKSEEQIAELEAQIEKMKMCCNCDRWRDNSILDKQNLDDSSYPCIGHDCDSRCSLWEIWKK